MKPYFHLSAELYAQVLDQLNGQGLTDCLGKERDLSFFKHDQWLCDSAVIERISERRGAWDVLLVFAHQAEPMQFLVRKITSHSCPKRAQQMAFYMRRLAAKDQRGTLVISASQFNMPIN